MKIIQNILLALGSFIISILFLETVVFKSWFPVTDVPRVQHENGITRYKANHRGISKLGNEYAAEFTINENGWNSHHTRYSMEKTGKKRVAVIGDSYIAGLEPGYKHSIPYLLEQGLGPDRHEVYAFGIGGAHLAQYLQLFKKEVSQYDPDLAIFLIVHNDFAPSYKKDLMASGRYGGTFLTLSILPDKKITEIPPQPYDPFWDKLLDFRSIRFAFYQHKLRTKISYIKNLVLNKQYQMNMPETKGKTDEDRIMTDYVVSNIMKIARDKNCEVVFVINGDTQAIYHGIVDESERTPLKLNSMTAEIVKKNGANFIDLHETFKTDFKIHRKIFEFATDGHWSPYGHHVAVVPIMNEAKRVLNKTDNN